MGKFQRLLKTTLKSQYIEFEFDPSGGNIIVSEINRHGERKEGDKAKVLYSGPLSGFLLAMEVPVEILKDISIMAEGMADEGNYPRTLEEAVEVGAQLPINDKGGEGYKGDPLAPWAPGNPKPTDPPPPALDDEEKTTCPDCEGVNDMETCGLCGGTGQVPRWAVKGPLPPATEGEQDAPEDPEKTFMVDGVMMTPAKAQEAAGF